MTGDKEEARLYDASFWYRRAEQARAVAAQITDSEARAAMNGIVDGYLKLAAFANRRVPNWGQTD